LPPLPAIRPALIKVTPPGNDPEIVKAGVPVDVDEIVLPDGIVAVREDDPFHPAKVAADAKFTLDAVVRLNAKAFDLPQKLVGIVIAPEATPAKFLTAVSLRDIVDVPDPPFSKAMDWPAVVPPKLIGPDEFNAIMEFRKQSHY
jgi:hypothetical protein